MQQFIGTLFQSRTQTHVAHLQTQSFAKHKALDEFYHEIIELADDLAEAYQGRYGIITGYEFPAVKDMTEESAVVSYFESLSKYVMVKRKKLPQDPCLQNVIDDIKVLIDSTMYKLKYLK